MGVAIEANGEMEKILHIKGDESGDAVKFVDASPIKETIDASHFPKDAVVDWGNERKIHSFYFVRLRPYDDPKVKHKIDIADKEIQKRTQSRLQIADELRAKRSEKAELKSKVRALIADSQKFRAMMDEKRKEIGPLQQALGKLRNTTNSGRSGLCSSEEELNEVIYSLKYRIQHESIPLTEEKQILRDIKALEGTREKVIANAALRSKIEESLGHKDALQDQVKLMGVNMDGVKKEQQAVSAKITQLDDKVKAIDKEINALQEELNAVSQKRDEAFDSIKALRTQRDEGNSLFYQSRTVMAQVKEHAAKKNIKELEDLSNSAVEDFMSLWNNNKHFRDDYEKRLLASLDSRFLCRDGRIRNPDEKPLIAEEPEVEPVKKVKEEPKPAKTVAVVHKEDPPVVSKIEKEAPAVEEEELKLQVPEKVVVDEAKLKEMKREEEMAKAKQTMERKKKLAERAAAKAAAKAQKEAEKKLKEREKKLKKKTSANAGESEAVEEAAVAAEEEEEKVAEEESENVKESAKVNVKSREKAAVRYRGRAKGERIPKAILMKRKSSNYWIWGAAIAVLVAALLLGYLYAF